MTTILHITHRSAWEAAQRDGLYRAPSLETQGFIHFSNTEQVLRVAHAFYRGETDLLLLVVDTAQLTAELRYEPPAEAPESSELFPHLYGALNLNAVTRVVPFPPDEDGNWAGLPALNEA
jgi:uncharacterized protein (DUF952 family)